MAPNSRPPRYTIAGVQPYGFNNTPVYDPTNSPKVGGEVSLYERIDWSDEGSVATAERASYSNPPFLGIGSTTGSRTPPWFGGSKMKRILRGYIRRDDAIPWSKISSASDEQKKTNARLFFMYNPEQIQRQYMTFDQNSLYTNAASSLAGAPQANVPIISQVIFQFDLLFDRQEEVTRLPNHPGVLIDLATLDMLLGSTPNVNAVNPTVSTTASTDGGGVFDSTSLAIDPKRRLAAIFSPNLAFRGTIMEAAARFEKFSHRMTPTRMTVSLTMRLTDIGREQPPNQLDPSTMNNAANTAASVAAVDPNQQAPTQQAADDMNNRGRLAAMQWASNWVAGHATPTGVPYSSDGTRCDIQENDSLTDFTGIHVPHFFDCSSLVSRSYAIIGWGDVLGVGPCGSTEAYWQAASARPNGKWKIIHPSIDRAGSWNDAQPGDCLVKFSDAAGGPTEHIAFLWERTGDKITILETNTSNPAKGDTHVHFSTATLDSFSGVKGRSFNYVLRAVPIQASGKVDKSLADAGGNPSP